MTIIDDYCEDHSLFYKHLDLAEKNAAIEPQEQHLWKNFRDSLLAMIKPSKKKGEGNYFGHYLYTETKRQLERDIRRNASVNV
jgi:hypothetical protein